MNIILRFANEAVRYTQGCIAIDDDPFLPRLLRPAMPAQVTNQLRALGHWFTLTSAFTFVIRAVGNAFCGIFRHQQLQHYFPTITYLAMHDLTKAQSEKSSSASCEHPPDQLRKYGNQAGRFHERKGCGCKRRRKTFVHTSTQHELAVKDEEFVSGKRSSDDAARCQSCSSVTSSSSTSPQRQSWARGATEAPPMGKLGFTIVHEDARISGQEF